MNATAPDGDQAEPEEEKSSDAGQPLGVDPGKALLLSSEVHSVPRTGDLIWSEKHEKMYECGSVVWHPTADSPGKHDCVVDIREPTLHRRLLRDSGQTLHLTVTLLVALLILMEIGTALS